MEQVTHTRINVEGLRVVLKLRDLAADPDNQKFLIKETGCLSSLGFFLDEHQPVEVLLPALQTLSFLASRTSNRAVIVQHQSLVSKVERLVSSSVPNVAHFASITAESLSRDPAFDEKENQSFKKKDLFQTVLLVPSRTFASVGTENGGFSTQGIQNALLEVKGVVSVVFDSDQDSITVYSVVDGISVPLIEALKVFHILAETPNERKLRLDRERIRMMNPLNKSAVSASNRSRLIPIQGMVLTPVEQILANNKHSLVTYGESFEDFSLAAQEKKKQREQEEQMKKQSNIRRFFSSLGNGLFW
jgi:hypothetical protein